MNIFFIGPYRQQDEWGRKSHSILKAIQRGGHNVTARPIFLSSDLSYNTYSEPSEFIILENYDILIQFVLQPYATYMGEFAKRIGIFNTETLPYNLPLGHLTKELLMDEVWIDSPSVALKTQDILHNHNTTINVKAIPPLLDVESLPLTSANSVKMSDPALQNRFIFYYIGSVADAKDGLRETVMAYTNAFNHQDAVALVVMPENIVDGNLLEQIIQECHACAGERNVAAHRPLIKALVEQPTLEKRMALHIGGDCMVCPSYSLTTSSLVLEAAVYECSPIVNKGNACYEWWGEENLWGVESFEEICIHKDRPLPYRFTSSESWHRPVVKSLSEAMKDAYTNKFKRDKKRTSNSKLREHFKNATIDIAPPNNDYVGKIS